MVSGILPPVLLGAIFALLLSTPHRWLAHRLGKAKRFAPIVLLASVVVLVLVPVLLIALQTIESVQRLLSRDWSKTIDDAQTFFSTRLGPLSTPIELIGADRIRLAIQRFAEQGGGRVAARLGAAAASLPTAFIELFLFLVSLFYFVRDGEKLARRLAELSPFQRHETEALFTSLHQTVQGSLIGMIVTALVQGVLTTIALAIFRVPAAFLLGVIATILALIVPMLGTTPVTVGAVLYLFAIDRTGAAIGMLVAAIVIGFSDNVVRPWVQSAQSNMHPLLGLLGIFGGLELFGAVGVFIGPVIAAMALWTFETYGTLHSRSTLEAVARPPNPPPQGAQGGGG
jgi:predicted PurR-regulated permease PerM